MALNKSAPPEATLGCRAKDYRRLNDCHPTLDILGIDRLRVAGFCIGVIRRLGVIAVCALIFSASLRFANSAHGIHLSYLALMSLLVFSILVLTIGIDIRRRGMAALFVGRSFDGLTANGFVAIGGWISFLGAIWLNISVWQLF